MRIVKLVIGLAVVLAATLMMASWLGATSYYTGPARPYVWHPLPASAQPPRLPLVPVPAGTQQLRPCKQGYTLWGSCFGGR